MGGARRLFAPVLAAAVAAGCGPAGAAATGWIGDEHAAVRLITATDAAGMDSTFTAGLDFRFAPGWHGYWRTPGDAGLGPVIDWTGSANVAGVTMDWPAPGRLVVEGLQNSVYVGRVVLPATVVTATAGAATRLHASVGYAACSNVCVPLQADLDLVVPAGPATAAPEAPAIAAARAAVPRAPAAAGIEVENVTASGTGTAHRLVVDLRSTAGPFLHPDLFVEGAGSGIPAAPRVELGDAGRTARLTSQLPEADLDAPLVLTLVDGTRAAVFGTGPPRPPAVTPSLGWLAAMASALLGGLVLNLMPCVLPVLSIKLLGLTRQVGAGRRAVRLGFVATAAGIIACFGLLALALIGLRLSGAALGWGLQFQQPWFLAGMATLTMLFAASFFDWVPIGLPSGLTTALAGRGRGPLVEAFLTGMVATLLATPCSAPFVGTAVGFALAQGPVEIAAIFVCLGIGMSMPYWAAALLPDLSRWLPRPGPWMRVLRRLLGAALLGTAAWLLVVLWSVVGARPTAAAGLALAVLLAGLAWQARQRGGAPRWMPALLAAVAAVPVAASLVLPADAPVPPTDRANWQAFDPAAVPRLVAAGKTVLVDVTATWCLTCKVNDLAALGTAAVRARLARPDVVRMRADWSRPDPVIAAYLHGFGRYGIPLDVVYGPARPAGEPLPELLTGGLVTAALDHAASPGFAASFPPAAP